MANNQQPVKAVLEDRDGAYNLYWNGKIYGTKCYVTATRQSTGSERKVTFDTKSGEVGYGNSTLSFGRQVLHRLEELNVEPFSKFDFSPR